MRAQHSELDVVPIVVRWRAHHPASRFAAQSVGWRRLVSATWAAARSKESRAPDRHALQTVTRVASVWESTLRGLIK